MTATDDRPGEGATARTKEAVSRLTWAWFAAHENQPMPEGRRIVNGLLDEIRSEAAREARAATLREVREKVDHLPGIDIRIDQEHIYADDRAHEQRFLVPPRTVTVTNGGPLLDRATVLAAIQAEETTP